MMSRSIGGYQVCKECLKDRMLSADDITHDHRIVIAVHETIRLMAEIDKTIDTHGRRPAAFARVSPSRLRASYFVTPYSPA